MTELFLSCLVSGQKNGVVLGFFMQFGVPIYAAAMGLVANNMITRAIDIRENKLLVSPIHQADFVYVANFLKDRSSHMDNQDEPSLKLVEYMLLCLLRLQRTDISQLKSIREKFVRVAGHTRRDAMPSVSLESLKLSGHLSNNKLVIPKRM